MEALTAFVLAGGKSTRMGADKAFLELSGQSLLANALELARSVSPEVRIVGDATRFSPFGAVVEDVYADRGPLGAVHAALSSSVTELNLMLAVDLPFLEARFLQFLIASAKETMALVTVPRLGGFYEPLCAVYRKPFAALADKALAENRNKLDALFSAAHVRIVDDEELAHQGFSSSMFRNLNTPADWERAVEEFGRRKHV